MPILCIISNYIFKYSFLIISLHQKTVKIMSTFQPIRFHCPLFVHYQSISTHSFILLYHLCPKPLHYNSFLFEAFNIPSPVRYLATVRLDTSISHSLKQALIFSSLKGRFLFSPSINSRILLLTAIADISS